MRFSRLAVFSAGLLAFANSPTTTAGVVELERVTLDEGNVTALLEVTSQFYVDAMRALIDERYRDDYRAIRWEALEDAMRDAPVARFEYRFTIDGVPGVRVYHAMGGLPLSSVAKSVFEGPTRPGTPETPSSPTESEDEQWQAGRRASSVDEVAVDLTDERFYTHFDDVNVRAPVLADDESVLDAFVVEGRWRAFDPEFKALRAIEKDLKSGTIPRGGSVYGTVSDIACTSCEYAMTRFGEIYEVDFRVAQVFPSLPRVAQSELIASGSARLKGNQLVDAISERPLLAADLLRGAREGQFRRSLSPRAMGRSFKGTPWARRSFQLNPARLPRLSESSSEDSPPSRPRVLRASTPDC
ncbi:MAG TPA: hypothetical protein VM621_06680 [Luteibacter sp.]|uniref:hypothetical protein n=1 Tax=Luteibacter sp. TaxID=1886636 RepID=UPI002CBEBBA3|nr:hypothetical protein [Luteibacter sp.]HVI54721.1 hypothetical protein [Luteibacter sp.]